MSTASQSVHDLADATAAEAVAVATDQYDRFAATIRRNPLQSAGIAAALGFVIAVWARGSHRRG
jgi:ElaB/YqjD/DUF883 family membrane-anchored ribosome-binding protein